MLDWLKDFFKNNNDSEENDLESFLASFADSMEDADRSALNEDLEEVDTRKVYTPEYRISDNSRVFTSAEVSEFMEKQKKKVKALDQRYANGELNKSQYESLLQHYQKKIHKLEAMTEEHNGNMLKRRNLPEGQTMIIRRAHAARLTGLAFFTKEPVRLLKTAGDFLLNREGLLPFINLVIKKPATEDGFPVLMEKINEYWVMVVCGEISVATALFSAEPTKQQVNKMRDLQLNFESANSNILNSPKVKTDLLVIPHQFFIGRIL